MDLVDAIRSYQLRVFFSHDVGMRLEASLPGLDNAQLRLFSLIMKKALLEAGRATRDSPAHECQRLLPLDLGALAGQLLLLVRERLLHQHHPNTLFHGVLLGLHDVRHLLAGGELGKADEDAQARGLGGGASVHRASLADVVDRLLHEVFLRI